jgi:hypothetical protein
MGATGGGRKIRKWRGNATVFLPVLPLFLSAETLSLKFHYFSFIFSDSRAKFEAFNRS